MAEKGKIESGKVFIKKIFTDFWFRVPNFQRSYVWGNDEVSELIDDILFASQNNPDSEYFLGSMVLQKKDTTEERKYIEYDVLDGQQRLTSVMMLISVIRDLVSDDDLKSDCNDYIFQKENRYKKIPERLRINYEIRDNVEDFINEFIKKDKGTTEKDNLVEKSKVNNRSISNMAGAILHMRSKLSEMEIEELSDLSIFLFNNVLMIYVSSENLDDAFRLFTILNDRGIPLTNSDILKAWNLGEVKSIDKKEKYARFWEDTEGNIGGDEFDRLLAHIRSIFVKDKARDSLLNEFEKKIYGTNPPLLKKGIQTLDVVKKYYKHYDLLIRLNDETGILDNEFKNLIIVMKEGLPSTDWIPSLLFYYEKFKTRRLLDFLKKLDNKFSADWLLKFTPTDRIRMMNAILSKIENSSKPDEILLDKTIFSIEKQALCRALSEDIYGKRFAKYIVFKLEFLLKDKTQRFNEFKYLSLEHVLPQSPKKDSQWLKDFDDAARKKWTHKLGNLVLMSRIKNSSLNNKDFDEKKKRYFEGNIDAFPNSLRIMQRSHWTPVEVEARQSEILSILDKHYKV